MATEQLQRFFHFTRWDIDQIDWEGREFVTPFISNYWQQHVADESGEGVIPLIEASFEAAFAGLFSKEQIRNIAHSNWVAQKRKETILEAVRLGQFTAAPSRSSCMFGLPIIQDPRQSFAAMGFQPSSYMLTIIEPISVEAMLVADSCLLDCNGLDETRIERLAAAYWSGQRSDSARPEVLFTGRYRIAEVLE